MNAINTGLLNASGHAIPRSEVTRVKIKAMFDSAPRASSSQSIDMMDWNPHLTSADGSWVWGRDTAIARVRDLVQNEGWAQAAVSRKTDHLVGSGWRYSPHLDTGALGISTADAARISKEIKSAFALWSRDPLFRCDLEREQTFNGLLSMAVREWVITGEALVVFRWREEELVNWCWRTALQVIDIDRLSNPRDAPDTETLRAGVEKDETGAPIAYHIRNSHPGEMISGGAADRFTWTKIPRWTDHGRPMAVHFKTKKRPGETRAVSDFVAGLPKSKMLSRFSEAELQNATVNALFAATIHSNMPLDQVTDSLGLSEYNSSRNEFYKENKFKLAGSKIAHLPLGDELKMNASPRQTTAYSDWQAAFLQSFASSLDLTYEELSMDFSRVNYSSARAAMVVVRRAIDRGRAEIADGLANLVMLAVIEEAIDLGKVKLPKAAPGLYEAPAAWLAGNWIGPALGWVDPVKEIKAATIRVDGGFSTMEQEMANQGLEFEQTLQQRVWERDQFAAYDLQPPSVKSLLPEPELTPETDPRPEV